MNCKNRNFKSAQVALNTSAQSTVATGTGISVLGNQLTDTGCSIRTNPAGFSIESTGLYCFRYVITFTADEAGTVALQLFKDGVALPCSLVQETVAAGSVYTLIAEVPALAICTCCNTHPSITAAISGVAGTVNYVCASAVKLA